MTSKPSDKLSSARTTEALSRYLTRQIASIVSFMVPWITLATALWFIVWSPHNLASAQPQGLSQPARQAAEGQAPPPAAGSQSGSTPQTVLSAGRQLFAASKAEAAVAQFREYIRLKPNDPVGYYWLGLALDQTGSPHKAIWSYGKSLDLGMRQGMDSAQLRVNIGNALMKLGRLDDAIFNYRRAIEIEPKLARAHFNLGRALLDRGDAEPAFAQLNRAAELGINDRDVHFFRAAALDALGKSDDAQKQIDLFLKGLPDTPDARALREKILQIGQPSTTAPRQGEAAPNAPPLQ